MKTNPIITLTNIDWCDASEKVLKFIIKIKHWFIPHVISGMAILLIMYYIPSGSGWRDLLTAPIAFEVVMAVAQICYISNTDSPFNNSNGYK